MAVHDSDKGTVRVEDIPDNTMVIYLSEQGEWVRYLCRCGSGGSVSMYDGNVEDLYVMARRHNILEHADTFEIRDRT